MREFKPRISFVEYWNLEELAVGEIPYSAIQRALRDEKYMRKFTPTFCRNDLLRGHLSALLYWYPFYINNLYELASDGYDPLDYFKGIPWNAREEFEYLMGETVLKLKKLQRLNERNNHLDEVKFRG
jgi:hypothetical protein